MTSVQHSTCHSDVTRGNAVVNGTGLYPAANSLYRKGFYRFYITGPRIKNCQQADSVGARPFRSIIETYRSNTLK